MPIYPEDLFPLKITIPAGGNAYGLPAGKTFVGRRKEGNGRPYPIVAVGDREYQFKEGEVIVEARSGENKEVI